jgi:hypothetical protein
MKTLSFFLILSVMVFNGCEEETLTLSNNKIPNASDTPLETGTNLIKGLNTFYFKTGLVSRAEFDLRVLRNGQTIVDWGDGIREKVFLASDNQNFIGHNYSTAGEYQISFSGNVKNISAFITNPPLTSINTKPLKSLETLLVTYSYASTYDLRNNTKLQQISIRALTDHTHFYMPPTHAIRYASFNDSSIKNINEIIASIHGNAVAQNIVDGTIYLENLRQHYLSLESSEKLSDLSENLNWEVHRRNDL